MTEEEFRTGRHADGTPVKHGDAEPIICPKCGHRIEPPFKRAK